MSVIWSFLIWHTRTSLYLTLACVKKHCSKVFIFHLFFISELSVSKSRGALDVVSCNLSWERQGYECPSNVGRVTRS